MDEIKLPWPEWKEIRKIGKGGYGTVYEIAYTDKFGVEEHAALKVLSFPQDETDNKILSAEGYEKRQYYGI